MIGPAASASVAYGGGGSADGAPVGDGQPAAGDPGAAGRGHHGRATRRACRPTPRWRRSRRPTLSPAYAPTPFGGSYTGTLTARRRPARTCSRSQNDVRLLHRDVPDAERDQDLLDDPSTPPVHTYSVAVNLKAGQTLRAAASSGDASALTWGTPSALAPGIAPGGGRGQGGVDRGGRGLRRHRVRGGGPAQPEPAVGAGRADRGGRGGQPAHGGRDQRGRAGA